MLRPRTLFAVILLLLANRGTSSFEWPEPYFSEPLSAHPNVTFTGRTPTIGFANILEGTDEVAEIMRLSYVPESDSDKPTISYNGNRGLGLQIATDDNPDYPFYIQATEPGDFESGLTRVALLVTPGGTSASLQSGNVYINVVNVNDNMPMIKSPESCRVKENYEGETDCDFIVTDEDGGACYVEMSVDDSHFALEITDPPSYNCKSGTFKLMIKESLDYEKYRLHSFEITAVDEGRFGPEDDDVLLGEQTRTLSFVVYVDDEPDEPPEWQAFTPFISVDEKTTTTQDFLAIDGDRGLDWPIKYSLEFEEEYEQYEKYFIIDQTGKLTIHYIDRDELKQEIFNMIVVATEIPDYERFPPDFQAKNASNTIVVYVNDLNDNSPKITPERETYEVEEEKPFTTGSFFRVEDPDSGNRGSFNLRLLESMWTENFLLVPTSGYQDTMVSISAIDPSRLDYEDEEWQHITLTIEAEEVENKTHVGRATIEIFLIDLIDEPPEFPEEEYEQSIPENQPIGTFVLQTEATDKDEEDVIRYILQNRYVSIDDNGNIFTSVENAFDRERQSELVFQVVAEDLEKHRAYCQVVLTITDINDEQPSLEMPYQEMECEEHSQPGTLASGIITATDPDEDPNLTFDIDWKASVAYKQGIALKNTDLFEGSVKLMEPEHDPDKMEWTTQVIIADSKTYDWEVFDTLKLQITVTDENTHPDYSHNRQRSGFVTVIVEDKNDCVPQFSKNSYSFNVTESTTFDRLIGAVLATDDDSEQYSQIIYSIEPTSPEGLVNEIDIPRVVIDENTGQIYTTKEAIDCDEWQELIFEYRVTANDSENVNYTTVIINIEDINDEVPKIKDPDNLEIKTEIVEHTEGRFSVSCITGIDRDVTVAYHSITYYIEGNSLLHFEMDKQCKTEEICCLWAVNGSTLDREEQDTLVVEVFSRDNYETEMKWDSNEGPKVTVTINLLDINDNPPVFEEQSSPFQHFESKIPESKRLFVVKVTDEDIGDNAEVECLPVAKVTLDYPERPDPDPATLFRVETEGAGCALYATGSMVNFWGMYTVNITATDKGRPKPLRGFGLYTLNITNENMNIPEIIYPESGISILITREQTVNSILPLKDIYGDDVRDFLATDKDDPATPNGQVAFNLQGSNIFYLDPSSTTNVAILRMNQIPNFGERKFSMKLSATDKAVLDNKTSETVNFDIYVLNTVSFPEFSEDLEIVQFKENETGLEDYYILSEAVNWDEEPLDTKRPIFYHIVDGDLETFSLDPTTRNLTLKKMLDFESVQQHELKVKASHSMESPEPGDHTGTSVLTVNVQVVDVNDMPPRFIQKVFPGTFSVDHESGQKVSELEAIDPDKDALVYYEMIMGTITAKDPSLNDFAVDGSFIVEHTTGIVRLNFNPNNRALSGYFEFGVITYDEEGKVPGHQDEAIVNVFVVSAAHKVQFHFFNPVSTVEEKEREIEAVFSTVLKYTCVTEKVRSSDSGVNVETAEVLTHFLDDQSKEPVPRSYIEDQFLDPETYNTLYTELSELGLSFTGFNNLDEAEESGSYLTVILAATCAVLAVIVVVFSLAFVVRTRTLNKRLDRLTSKKFGSQDSGINRAGMGVPGTNLHALEGSNPVWNQQLDDMYDNMSVDSGDSDLVGIEDSPDFTEKGSHKEAGSVGHVNRAFQLDAGNSYATASAPVLPSLGDTRRPSLNPLAAAAANGPAFDAALPEPGPLSLDHFDLDLDLGLDLELGVGPGAGAGAGEDSTASSAPAPAKANGNFSFQNPDAPATEL